MSALAPLEDPAYDPVHKPVDGWPPDVVAKWGPRSQVRWFNRFRKELRRQKYTYWEQFYCASEQHRGSCCSSCIGDQVGGWRDWDEAYCCCQAMREDAASEAP